MRTSGDPTTELDRHCADLIVIGNGMVGQRLVDRLVSGGFDGTILVIGDEPRRAYDRVGLSALFDGATPEDLDLVDPAVAADDRVQYWCGCRVEGIDVDARRLACTGGRTVDFGRLVIATGSVPFVPPIPGRHRPGVFVYRTIEDVEAITAWAHRADVTSGAVIGGGLLGLEAANALVSLGLPTGVVEMAPHLMPQQLDADGGEMLARWIRDLDVEVLTGFATEFFDGDGDDGAVRAVVGTETSVPADIVVISAGIRPADGLARDAGLDLAERGGVLVDDRLRVSRNGSPLDDVFAIGEVAAHHGRVFGLVGPGYDMAAVVADQLLDTPEPSRFTGADMSAKLKLLGVGVASFGQAKLPPATAPGTATEIDEVVYSDPTAKIHRRLVVGTGPDGTVQLLGGTLVGDTSAYEILHAMATGQAPTPAEIGSLVLPEGLSPAADLVLPDSAQMCSCNSVCAGDVRDAVRSGCQSVGAVKSETTAGTGCAGCVPALTKLVNDTLRAEGIAVSDSLCEHFSMSRADLFGLIRFHRHATWSEVLAAHGTGRGCEICRPTVASILASLSNGYILDGDQGGLQDTNDHALANMQRNGTYSVVPRVPGGEITPQQLIALGEIASDFDLYTKITGAQRIDLFGAQLHELPLIWERVIAAGMESGHAYGKALRTVKSCVGSTWCRYGVQDSVGMAINLELRYRGLRAPHKLKMAVSGCTRECAEAQSKDVGVIATETGWNLYLAGNGGRAPRHADLFATDLGDDELIRLIDRFLMFYIRTADRLQRTSVWFEELDGGIEHLRRVIVDDSLGICDELDAEMARHVDTYECEWSATLADPARRAHFVEFVNAPETTWTPVWIEERGQKVPR